jgi:hypothetical protein
MIPAPICFGPRILLLVIRALGGLARWRLAGRLLSLLQSTVLLDPSVATRSVVRSLVDLVVRAEIARE